MDDTARSANPAIKSALFRFSKFRSCYINHNLVGKTLICEIFYKMTQKLKTARLLVARLYIENLSNLPRLFLNSLFNVRLNLFNQNFSLWPSLAFLILDIILTDFITTYWCLCASIIILAFKASRRFAIFVIRSAVLSG